MEQDVMALMQLGVAVDLLAGQDNAGQDQYGVRLRTFGKQVPKNKMLMAGAITFEAALEDCLVKAAAGRWENLDWAARPWTRRERSGDYAAIGL